MTLFGLISLFNFIACGSLFLTFLYLSYKPLIRSYLKRSSPEEKRLARQRTNISEILPSLNLLLICTTSCIPWIFLYLDHDVAYATKAPPFGVCLTQGSMVMTWAAFVSGGAACVITKMWARVVFINKSLIPYRMPTWLSITLLLHPWITMFSFFFASLAIGIQTPARVKMGQFYCWIYSNILQNATLGVCCAHLLLVLFMEIHLTIFIFRHLERPAGPLTVTETGPRARMGKTREKQTGKGWKIGGLPASVVLRPMLFGLVGLVGLGMTTVTLIVNRTATWGKIVLAVIPSTSFLAYVTHPAILQAWKLDKLLKLVGLSAWLDEDYAEDQADSDANNPGETRMTGVGGVPWPLNTSISSYDYSAEEIDSKTSTNPGSDMDVPALLYDNGHGQRREGASYDSGSPTSPTKSTEEGSSHDHHEVDKLYVADQSQGKNNPSPAAEELFRRGMEDWQGQFNDARLQSGNAYSLKQIRRGST